jgi:hypothetical protein
MYVSVLIRRLRPGKTYDDFVRAWYPDKGFGVSGRGPILARDVHDEREIVAVALMELDSGETLDEFDFSTDEAVARGRPPGIK